MKIALKSSRIFYLICLFLFANSSNELQAQTTGGSTIFTVLELPQSARTTAFGGQQINYTHADIALIGNNPALLNSELHQHINFSTLFLPAGINAHNLTYAHDFKQITGALQFQFINYGKFNRTDVSGVSQGEFFANDLVLAYSTAYQKDKWTFGATGKFIYSVLESYTSTALAADAGISWHNPETNTSFSAVVKNVGTVLNSYNGTEEIEDLPFDVQFGFSKRLEHVPFRFSMNAHSLHRWDIRFDDPNETGQNSLFGEDEIEKSYFTDELFRHFIFAGELYLGKPLSVQIAYNHKTRQEMRLNNRSGLAGFSFGLGIKTKKFTFNYGLGVNSLAGSAHHLSFSTSISQWMK